jgi:hypothetical protein
MQAVWDQTTKTAISGSASSGALTISYDADTKGYTATIDGKVQTFLPADVSSTDEYDTVYRKTSGGTTDYLTLIDKTYVARLDNKYVRMGTWQRNTVTGSSQNVDFTAFVYGLPTADAAVPRAGKALYAVDAYGLVSVVGYEPRSFQGAGSFTVDFGEGVYGTQTYLTEYDVVSGGGSTGGGIEVVSGGSLSAGGNAFAGNMRYGSSYGTGSGTMTGRFYGPNGEEIGATFQASNGSLSVVGGLVGQLDDTYAPANLTLTNLTKQEYFYADYGRGTIGGINWQNAETFVAGPPSSQFYGGQFTIADKVSGPNSNFTYYAKTFSGTYDSQDVKLSMFKPGATNTQLALTYASFGLWSTATPWGAGGSVQSNMWFAYGFQTPSNFLTAKTGTAQYQGLAYGTGQLNTGPMGTPQTLYDVNGTSRFAVDFGAQTFSGSLDLKGTGQVAKDAIDFGRYTFDGRIFGYSSTLQGVIAGAPNSEIAGRFYGPDGQEIATPFNINVPEGAPGAGIAIMGVAAATKR